MSTETEDNGDASHEIADGASRYLGRLVELLTDRERDTGESKQTLGQRQGRCGARR